VQLQPNVSPFSLFGLSLSLSLSPSLIPAPFPTLSGMLGEPSVLLGCCVTPLCRVGVRRKRKVALSNGTVRKIRNSFETDAGGGGL